MTRFLLAGMLGTALVMAAAPSPAADAAWDAHLGGARAALAAGDDVLARGHLVALDSLAGGHAGAKSALATLAAREGRREAALSWLRAFAGTGLARRLDADSTFARWHDDPEFRAVAARLDSNAAPLSRAVVGPSLRDTLMLAEDLAWDARGRRFLVSSIHRGHIVAVDAAGRVSDFTAPGTPEVWGVYALVLDAKRGRLWATTVAGPEYEGFAEADSGRTALLEYDAGTGRLQRRFELTRLGVRQALGDLSLGPDGTVYAAESYGGAVYRLPPGVRSLETLVPRGGFRSPQGSAVAADCRRLYVADYGRGIAAVDLASGAVAWMAKPYSLASGGIDGLYRDGDRLLAIQNGTAPHRVLELRLDQAGAAIRDWRVLEQASERLGEPNHGTFAGGDFWLIGDSGWDRVGEEGRMHDAPGALPPVLLRLGSASGR